MNPCRPDWKEVSKSLFLVLGLASALALMLRSQGIPSRLVLGYRCDEWDAAGKFYQVRQTQAHAWVEVSDGSLWRRIDLGGAGRAMDATLAGGVKHETPPDPFAWPANATRVTS